MDIFQKLFYENVTKNILKKNTFQKYMFKFIKHQNEKTYNKLIKYILCKMKNINNNSDNVRIMGLFKIIYDGNLIKQDISKEKNMHMIKKTLYKVYKNAIDHHKVIYTLPKTLISIEKYQLSLESYQILSQSKIINNNKTI